MVGIHEVSFLDLAVESDAAIDIDEFDGECDSEVYYPCPYCSDDYDLLELCLHIDEEHPVEADSGV